MVVAQEMGRRRGGQSQRRGFCPRGDLLGILQIISEHEGELEASACDSPSHRNTACSGAGVSWPLGQGLGRPRGTCPNPDWPWEGWSP